MAVVRITDIRLLNFATVAFAEPIYDISIEEVLIIEYA
jgi:hypothetical protein